MSLTIEKDVPPPPPRAPRGYFKSMFDAFAIGDSVLIPYGREQTFRITAAKRRFKVSGRKQPDGSTRFWVTAVPAMTVAPGVTS